MEKLIKEFRPRLNKHQAQLVVVQGRRVLVIGDLHEPFTLDEYIEFCVAMYHKWGCTDVVFVGDILDNHFSSFHDTDPDGHSAGEELDRAMVRIEKWYKAFPVAKVCIGNHDAIPDRKAFNAGLSKRWIKTVGQMLGVDGWEFADQFIIDGVKYVHGLNRKARQRAKDDLISVVQGHYHSESYIEFFVGERYKIFAMQLGCGLDRDAYASAYARNFKKQHINVGIILDDGQLPILEYMKLGSNN